MLVSVAELSNIFSVVAVLVCFCAMVLFILRYVPRTLSAAPGIPRLRGAHCCDFAPFPNLYLNFFVENVPTFWHLSAVIFFPNLGF